MKVLIEVELSGELDGCQCQEGDFGCETDKDCNLRPDHRKDNIKGVKGLCSNKPRMVVVFPEALIGSENVILQLCTGCALRVLEKTDDAVVVGHVPE